MSFRKLIDSGIDFEQMVELIDITISYTSVNAIIPG
jgi:hypothetical protein